MKFIAPLLVSCLAVSACLAQAKKDDTPKPAQSIAELRQQLEKILADSHTPGMSVTIVHRDGPEWVAGLGKSDVATNHAATDETLFRIGSTSKAFASLSILKLANEGKLSLLDPVRKLAPEIWFENRWEATDPVRVVDLLEHTTGWDDMHLREYAKDAKGMTLREGLDYYHHSRYSRWRPGTRMSYCNSGPAVAAYIVEKITGPALRGLRHAELLSAHRHEDGHLFRAAFAAVDHPLSCRRQNALSLLEHPASSRRIDQRLRQRHGGVRRVLSESRRGGRDAGGCRLPPSIAWRRPPAPGRRRKA